MKTHFHEGELKLQKKYNAWHDPKLVERLLKDHIVSQLIPFIEQQTTVILSTTDSTKNIWASMFIGTKGFVEVLSPKYIRIHLDKLKSTKADILFKNIKVNSKIGLLFIDTVTRTRYRLNGYANLLQDRLEIEVLEAYPNCPKYIQQRILKFSEDSSDLGAEQTVGTVLTTIHKQWINEANTFFLGSMNANGDMDASHRGGPTGFVEILENGVLKIPDYVGNNLFNTLGNFVQFPKAGLLFIDFEKGHSLQLSGKTELVFDQEETKDLEITTGTGRYWLFKTEQWIQTQTHHKIDWEFVSFSPFNPQLKS